MKSYVFIFLLLISFPGQSQNLVLNGSFEMYTGCPTNFSQIDSVLHWMAPTVSSSSDYYNECADAASSVGVPVNGPGYQEAFYGVAYSGIYLAFPSIFNYREYLEVQLTDTLVASLCYHFEMYVNLTNTCKFTTESIGVYFSDTAITGINNFLPLPVTAQIENSFGNTFDTLTWTLVSGEYIATGNETHLIIGNFNDDAGTNINVVNMDAPFDFVYVLVDNVSLNACKPTTTVHGDDEVISIYPIPVDDLLNVQVSSSQEMEIILYDLTLKRLSGQKFRNTLTVNTKSLMKGLYFYEISAGNQILKQGKIVKQ